MLKKTNEPAPSKNDGSKSASSRNNNSRPASRRNDGNDKIDGFDGDGVEYAKKSGKSKGQKTSKSQKLSKLRKSKGENSKKPSKSGNLPNFDAKDSGPSFLTPEARSVFNHLRLAFTEAPIFWYFDPEYYIWIETDALGYVISGVLNRLVSGTRPNGVVTKTDLD